MGKLLSGPLLPRSLSTLRRRLRPNPLHSRLPAEKAGYQLTFSCVDETVINGAQIFFFAQFGIEGNALQQGVVNGAPYLCCAVLGCWLTIPLNNWLGRRGVILFGALLSIVACLWQALVGTWWHMVIARLSLGMAIGPMSATVPIYAAETTPPKIRSVI